MSEPLSTAATVPAASAGLLALTNQVLTVAGISTGIPVDVLLPAFMGALYSLKNMEEGGFGARLTQVIGGTLFAAWSAPYAASAIAYFLPAVQHVDPAGVRFPAAALLGWGGLTLVLPRLQRFVEGPLK